MYTHTVRKFEDGEWVETRTNVSRQIYRQLLAQVIQSPRDKVQSFLMALIFTNISSVETFNCNNGQSYYCAGGQTEQCHHPQDEAVLQVE